MGFDFDFLPMMIVVVVARNERLVFQLQRVRQEKGYGVETDLGQQFNKGRKTDMVIRGTVFCLFYEFKFGSS